MEAPYKKLGNLPRKRKGNSGCCIAGCSNRYCNTTTDVHFYSFPKEWQYPERRQKWIEVVKRQRPDGEHWEPSPLSRICSAHFVGGRKSEHPLNPAFLPTIMPGSKTTKEALKRSVERFQRYLKRSIQSPAMIQPKAVTPKSDVGVQTDFPDSNQNVNNISIMFSTHVGNNVETQTEIYLLPLKIPTAVQTSLVLVRPVENKICGSDTPPVDHFSGYDCISDEEEMTGLVGMSRDMFNFLLQYTPKASFQQKITRENRLLMFLLRMRLGLTFAAMGVIFQVNRATVSRIFKAILDALCSSISASDYIFWPDRFTVKSTTPAVVRCFSNLRAYITCFELKSDKPNCADKQVSMYSHFKGAYTMKYFLAVLPNGMIAFISDGYGGKNSDIFVTLDSGFFDIVEPDDDFMSNRDYPEIREALETRGAKLLTPPTCSKGKSETDNEKAKYIIVRLHVERSIASLNVYRILDRISNDMFPYIDRIVKMCCILHNLQKPFVGDK